MTKYAFINEKPYSITDGQSIFSFVSQYLGSDFIPTLCEDSRLKSFGSCRMCSVEVSLDANGSRKILASCHTPVSENQHIYTHSSNVVRLRKNILQMLQASYPESVQESDESTHLTELQKYYQSYEIKKNPYVALNYDHIKLNDHPYIAMDTSKCIHCFKCVRVCDEIQGQFVLQRWGRGFDGTIVPGNEKSFLNSPCVSCGACVQICPTEALIDRKQYKYKKKDSITRTVCTYCGVGCNLEVSTINGEIVQVDGAKYSEVNESHTCIKGRFAFGFYKHPDRIRNPKIKRNGVFEDVSWDEAFEYIAQRLNDILQKHGGSSVGALTSARCTNEENYLMQKFMRTVIQSNNVDCCARVCHAPTAYGMMKVFGTGAATNSINEIGQTDCLLVVGANPTEAHPVTGARIKQRALKGIPLIVIDPRKTELATFADFHLQLKPGTNIALLNMFAYYILLHKKEDKTFIESRTEGFANFRNQILNSDINELEKITGVDRFLVEKAALTYSQAKTAMTFHGLGVTEHFQGSKTVMTLSSIVMMCGYIGRTGCGLNPLRGQNNVQGAADMGSVPNLGAGYLDFTCDEIAAHFEKIYQMPVPREVGLTGPEMFAHSIAGNLKALWIIGEDVMQSDPDTKTIHEALSNLDFFVIQELFETNTTQLADVVLPASSFFEKNGTFTNGERRVQRVNRVVEPLEGTKPDGEIITKVMQKMGYPQPDYDAALVLEEICKVIPFMQGAIWGHLGKNGLQWPVSDQGDDCQIMHTDTFSNGLGQFKYFDYEVSPEIRNHQSEFPLTLTTGRILQHYNCGAMTRRTDNIEFAKEDVLLIHPQDASHYNVKDRSMVKLSSPRGSIKIRAKISNQVNPGVVYTTFHHPETEANKITSCVMDIESMTPEFKVIAAQVEAI